MMGMFSHHGLEGLGFMVSGLGPLRKLYELWLQIHTLWAWG